ncbi:MAG: glycosyltransferase family 2 protein [Candidatus Thorarchaeota archaeon]
MISVVIPMFNEEENVSKLLTSIYDVMNGLGEDFELIVVDDGSTDSTLNNLKHEKKNPDLGNLRILELRTNFGQTPALLAGFSRARGDIIVSMDGDLQNDPNDIPGLLKKLDEGYDVVCGWRKHRKDSIFKRIPSRISNYLNHRLNGINIHDSGCTIRAYTSEAAKDLKITGEGHRYIPAILSYHGYKVTEIPVNHRIRYAGKSKYGPGRLIRGFMDLISLRIFYGYRSRPFLLFGIIGIPMFITGFILSVYMIYERLYLSGSLSDRPAFFISVMMCIAALQILLTGFIAELFTRSAIDPQDTYKVRKEH